MDFNKYDDMVAVRNYDGFIDPHGNFYKVCLRANKSKTEDFHNQWAKQYINEKLNVYDFKFNPTVSSLFALSSLNGESEVLINCFGYVYYSHDPDYYKPIVIIPNPLIGNCRVTEEQLNSLFILMTMNKESTDIPIFDSDTETYSYCGVEDYDYGKRRLK